MIIIDTKEKMDALIQGTDDKSTIAYSGIIFKGLTFRDASYFNFLLLVDSFGNVLFQDCTFDYRHGHLDLRLNLRGILSMRSCKFNNVDLVIEDVEDKPKIMLDSVISNGEAWFQANHVGIYLSRCSFKKASFASYVGSNIFILGCNFDIISIGQGPSSNVIGGSDLIIKNSTIPVVHIPIFGKITNLTRNRFSYESLFENTGIGILELNGSICKSDLSGSNFHNVEFSTSSLGFSECNVNSLDLSTTVVKGGRNGSNAAIFSLPFYKCSGIDSVIVPEGMKIVDSPVLEEDEYLLVFREDGNSRSFLKENNK